jgi:hypothetical protein
MITEMKAEVQAKKLAEMQAIRRSSTTGLRRRGLMMVKNRKLLLMFFQRIVKSSICLLKMSPISARYSRIYPRMLR